MTQGTGSNGTGLQFTIKIEGLDPETFAVIGFEGQESLSAAFAFDIELASQQESITAQQVVDRPVSLTIWHHGEKQQQWHGIASQFAIGDSGHHHTFYSLTLVPPLFRATLRRNSRIFQQHTTPEIISVLLQEMGITDYLFALKNEYQPREYCVQYRESDLAFIERLAAEEGLFYYFSHKEGKNIVIFSDDCQQQPLLSQWQPYNAMAGGTAGRPYVRQFARHTRSAATSVQLSDYSFKNPAYHFQHTAQGAETTFQQTPIEHFDYPGRFKSDACGKPFTQYRCESLRRETITATGSSNIPQLLSGVKFVLGEHPEPDCNRDWLPVSIRHSGSQPQALEQAGGNGMTRYHNQFTAIPGHRQWRPAANTKPRVDGPQMATVVGPAGEEIYCDEFGRVKVQFPWDRYSDNNDKASCWIRVSQGWAGSQYGMVTVPRIGNEVIVSFLEGDPDQPIITGRTYHAGNTPPYSLPDNKTRTVLRTETHQGNGYNEVRFEDQAGSEEIFVHAQKDTQIQVGNDQIDVVKHDRHLEVGNNRITHIKASEHLTVDGESRHHTKGDMTLIVDGSLHLKQGKAWISDSGKEIHIKAGSKVILEAGTEITVKAGGSLVKIDPSGVKMHGGVIRCNSGGSAGNGSGYQGQAPTLPDKLAPPPKVKDAELTPLQIATLKAAAPFCQECEACKNGECSL